MHSELIKRKRKSKKKLKTKILKLNDLKKCLLKGKVMIQTKRHQIYTLKQNKLALNENNKKEFKKYIFLKNINAYKV